MQVLYKCPNHACWPQTFEVFFWVDGTAAMENSVEGSPCQQARSEFSLCEIVYFVFAGLHLLLSFTECLRS